MAPMTTNQPTEPTYAWRGWELDPKRPQFDPTDDDLRLMSVLGVAMSYEVWLVAGNDGTGYSYGVETQVCVIIPGGGSGNVVREYVLPAVDDWKNASHLYSLVTGAAQRWALEQALNDVALEGLL